MGVMVGILRDGDAPCVETPESPEITISQPMTLVSAAYQNVGKTLTASGDVVDIDMAAFVNSCDIESVRQITVKRTFYCKKKDIPEVTLWLNSLVGGSIDYNAGADGVKTIAGGFRLVGSLKFTSYSPSISMAEAEYVGWALDCNFLFPPGLEFVRVDDTHYNIVLDDEVFTSYESSSVGDGSGLSFRAGRVMYWDEVPLPQRNSLAMCMDELPADAGSMSSSDVFYMLQYREIILALNGEALSTWYIPVLGLKERKRLFPQKVYMGITETQYVNQSYTMHGPVGMENLEILYEEPAFRIVDVDTGQTYPITQPSPDVVIDDPAPDPGEPVQADKNFADMPVGLVAKKRTQNRAVHVARAGIEYLAGGSWLPEPDYTVSNLIPVEHTRMVFIGWEYVPRLVSVSGKPSSDAAVSIQWRVSNSRVQLIAVGIDGEDQILMDMERPS